MEIVDFTPKDLIGMDLAETMFDLENLNKEAYAHLAKLSCLVIKTAYVDDEPILTAGVWAFTYYTEEDNCGEGLFFVSKKLPLYFRKYGKGWIREIKKYMLELGLDKIYCSCYNTFKRSEKLIRLLGFKYDRTIPSRFGPDQNIYVLEVNNV